MESWRIPMWELFLGAALFLAIAAVVLLGLFTKGAAGAFALFAGLWVVYQLQEEDGFWRWMSRMDRKNRHSSSGAIDKIKDAIVWLFPQCASTKWEMPKDASLRERTLWQRLMQARDDSATWYRLKYIGEFTPHWLNVIRSGLELLLGGVMVSLVLCDALIACFWIWFPVRTRHFGGLAMLSIMIGAIVCILGLSFVRWLARHEWVFGEWWTAVDLPSPPGEYSKHYPRRLPGLPPLHSGPETKISPDKLIRRHYAEAAMNRLGGASNLGRHWAALCAGTNIRQPRFLKTTIAAIPVSSAAVKLLWPHLDAATFAAMAVLLGYFSIGYFQFLRLRAQAMHPTHCAPCTYMPLIILMQEIAARRDDTDGYSGDPFNKI
ncbi:MAG: hypothetical protein ACYC3L_05870 [Gemmatimonadaceae bacterium]